jgi:osmotically-inducible protein OsmY
MNNAFIKSWVMVIALLAGLAACTATPTRESTGELIDDSAITTRIKSAMIRDSDVAASNISVETFRGTVRLSGFASTAREADKAEQIARNTQGVKSVKNDIRVQ